MQIQQIQQRQNNKPAFGNMIFKPMNHDFIKAIENNPSFNELSKELETIGKNLIFSTGSCCDAYTVGMYAGNTSRNVYLGQVAGYLPANCNKMVEQLKTYSCDCILEAVRLGKSLFNK